MSHTDCPKCHGTGKIPLSTPHAETLLFIKQKRLKRFTGTELAPMLGCQASTMGMRLAKLEDVGLLTSRIDGCKRIYALNPKGTR